jgi:serine/threonine protein kinase
MLHTVVAMLYVWQEKTPTQLKTDHCLGSQELSSSASTISRPFIFVIPALDQDDGPFENRIFSCLVISPPGRAIHEFTSVEELLEACRDVIKGHRSLYYDGKILHRDISENNLIITEIKQKGDPRGKLIDLDLAKELDGGPSGARHRTGTMEFMAIEVLEGRPHTYRHDLESLFYVFLWVIICHQGPGQGLPKDSPLRGWYRGSYAQIADMKGRHMDKKRFKGILAEFPPVFEGLRLLAEELRDILFPYREGLFTGTYGDPDKLYQPMIDAFDRAIAR